MGEAQAIWVVPESSEHPVARIGLNEAECAVVRKGIAYWRGLCGARRFPSRAHIIPRDLSGILRNTVLIRIVEAGADYEYRIVGDAHVVAHGFCMQGRLLSEMSSFARGYGKVLKNLYDPVVRERAGYGLRGWISRGQEQSQYIHSESVFLPLGPDDATVDHILNFSVYTMPRAIRA